MKIRIGDRVRFLSAEGGGKVSRIDGRTVYVEDEDGFEIPTMESDLVVVSAEDEKRQGTATRKGTYDKPKAKSKAEEDEDIMAELRPLPKSEKKDEAPSYNYDADATDDTDPHFAIALLRTDGGNTGSLDMYVVNDSNYFGSYVLMRVDAKGMATTIDARTIEPNTKEKVDTLNPQQVDGMAWRVQLILFKKYRQFCPQQVFEQELKPKGSKLFRDGSFLDNDYFDEKAIVMHVIKDEMLTKMEQLTDAEMVKGAKEGRKTEAQHASKSSKPGALIEVDLHIEELLPDTRGLDNKDMLKAQTDHFKSTMEKHKNHKGQKIVFIHGVGQGVLKNEILRLLRVNYPTAQAQDASFAEYGFGATMVTI